MTTSHHLAMPLPRATGGTGWVDSETTPIAKTIEIAIDDIEIPSQMRPIDEEAVARIVDSIDTLGLQLTGLVSVRWNAHGSERRATLVAGRHRLEAFRRLGWAVIPATLFDGSPDEAELWRIAENLARKELTTLERADQISRWVGLKAVQNAHPVADQQQSIAGGQQPGDKGISSAARELGLDRRSIQRHLKIAGLCPEAKQVAIALGLSNTQMALQEAARKTDPDEQIAVLHKVANREKARKAYETGERTPAQIARSAKNVAVLGAMNDGVEAAATSLMQWLGKMRAQQLIAMIDNIPFQGMAEVMVFDRLRSLLRPGAESPGSDPARRLHS